MSLAANDATIVRHHQGHDREDEKWLADMVECDVSVTVGRKECGIKRTENIDQPGPELCPLCHRLE